MRSVPSIMLRARARRAALLLPVLAAGALFQAPSAAARNLTSPGWVNTIGVSGEAEMYPSGVAVDSAGNVVVADTGNDRIKLFPAGSTIATWSVGTRGLKPGGAIPTFSSPRDVAVDASFVYVADTDNNVVQVLNKSDGSFARLLNYKVSTPIGISVGSDGHGNERILVSNGVSGTLDVFDAAGNHKLSIPQLAAHAGTRDAATDSAGNFYVCDYRGNRINKYDPTGHYLMSFANTGPISQQSPKPYGVDVDSSDHIYVASSDLEQVQIYSTTGAYQRSIGTKGTTTSTLFQLRRVAVGHGANPLVYTADLWGLKILTYNNDGSIASSQPLLGNGVYPPAGGLNQPHTVSVTSQYIFVTNTVNQRMERFNLDGSNPIDWGTKGVAESTAAFNWAQGIGVDPQSGNVWVANTRNNRIDEFTPDGSGPLRSIGGARLASSFNWPMSVSFDGAGNLYVADTFGNDIQSWSVPAGTGTPTQRWKVSSAGGGFSHPWDAAFDPAGNRILVADTLNSRIVSLNPANGSLNSVLNISKGTQAGQVTKPMGVAPAGANMWIADTGNNRIEEFSASGSFTGELLGSYGSSNSQFNAPQGIVIGPGGLLYVADVNNNRVQVFRPV